MSDSTKPDPAEPRICFGDEWIPAHLAWKKMETANVAADAIERFNTTFPHLSTEITRDVVPLTRRRLKAIQLEMPLKVQRPDLVAEAATLLSKLNPEDAAADLSERFGVDVDLVGLVQLVGEEAYLDALVREAVEYRTNRISPDQTASLWNDAHRPAPGGGRWSSHDIERLLEQAD
jgi:hypothetical protein